MTTYELEDIELMEVSAVDRGANQHAAVVLCKRVAPESLSGYTEAVKSLSGDETQMEGDRSVTVEELTQKLETLQTQVADLTEKAAASDALADSLTKSAKEAGLEVEDGKIVKRADPEYVEVDGEKVEKALVPAAVLRAIEKQAADIAKMKAEAADVALAKRGATELPNLAGTDLTKGRLLAAVEGDEALLKALKAADAAMAETYTEKGHSNVEDEAAPGSKLDKLAKAHAEAKGVSFEMAFAEVTKSGVGADLLAQMRNAAN
jgi:phage host-nuclease inhibitor protein Gam